MSSIAGTPLGSDSARKEVRIEALFGLILFIGIVAGIIYLTRGKPDHRRRKDVQGWAEAQRDEWR